MPVLTRNLLAAGNTPGSGSGWIILFLVSSVAVIAGSYYLTRFLANKMSSMGQGRQIRIRESVVVARGSLRQRDKMVCIIEVKGKAYLVAFTANTVALLDTMDAEDIAEPEKPQTMKFTDALRATMMNRFGKSGDADAPPRGTEQDTDRDDE